MENKREQEIQKEIEAVERQDRFERIMERVDKGELTQDQALALLRRVGQIATDGVING